MANTSPRRRWSRWTAEPILMMLPVLVPGLVLVFTLMWALAGSLLVGLLFVLVAATILVFFAGFGRLAEGKVF